MYLACVFLKRTNKRISLNFLHFMQDKLMLHLAHFAACPLQELVGTSSLWTSCMAHADSIGQAICVKPKELRVFCTFACATVIAAVATEYIVHDMYSTDTCGRVHATRVCCKTQFTHLNMRYCLRTLSGACSPQSRGTVMVSHIHAFVRVRPLLPREFAQSTSEAVTVYEVSRRGSCFTIPLLGSCWLSNLCGSGPKDQSQQRAHCAGV